MIPIAYFTQSPQDLFEPPAGLNPEGVAKSYHNGLLRAREHIVSLIAEAQPGGSHEKVCYHLQVGTSILMSLFDGLAVYVEKKLSDPPAEGIVHWKGARTFVDPRFADLRMIQQRTEGYIIKGGVTADTLRNFAMHYLPWMPLTDNSSGSWDIAFPMGSSTDTKTGPVIKDLLRPLFNDFCQAYAVLCSLLKVQGAPIHGL